jgi:hypothetical protein
MANFWASTLVAAARVDSRTGPPLSFGEQISGRRGIMNLKLLIDGIVRQTTVLIAQLSTASGSRSPLAHVADQVFFTLAREIEAQGVKKQVVADMFGLAMRSYQKKMARLTESASVRDRTLWEAVLEFVAKESPTRARVLERFSYDGERDVVAVLNDLVRTGLLYTTGSGDGTVFGATSSQVQATVQRQHDKDSLLNLAWLSVFRGEATADRELSALLGVDLEEAQSLVEDLVADGRLRRDGELLRSSNLVVPLGAEQGWETAVLDHFRTVSKAIALKVRLGFQPAGEADRVGGSTFTFSVTPGHPFEAEVYDLLRETRARAQALWDRVSDHNIEHAPNPEHIVKVSFYAGQTLESATLAREEEGEP